MLTSSQITRMGLGLAMCAAAYKFVSNPIVKAAAAGVAGVIIAKQIPYVSDALA